MKNLKQPNFFINTRKGTVYQLTPFYQKQLNMNNFQINMGDFVQQEQLLQKLKEKQISFRKFLGFSDQQVLYTTPIDTYRGKECIIGLNNKNLVKILGQQGYSDVTDEKYAELATLINPDIIVQLTEYSAQGGKGSTTRAVEKSIEFLDHIINKIQESNKNLVEGQVETQVYGSIQGGQYEELRELATQNLCQRDVQGGVIHGLCQEETLEKRTFIYETIKKNIPEDKNLNLVLAGSGNPIDILHALQFGIKQFELEYPFLLAQNGIGLNITPVDLENLKSSSIETENEDKNTIFKNKKCNYLDLKDPIHKDKIHGLVEGCQCYACQNHTMAYIHHALKCKELIAHILLTIHNQHTYNLMFEQLQTVEQTGQLQEYTQQFLKQNTVEGGKFDFEIPQKKEEMQNQQKKKEKQRFAPHENDIQGKENLEKQQAKRESRKQKKIDKKQQKLEQKELKKKQQLEQQITEEQQKKSENQ